MNISLEQLLEKPLWQMTGQEFFILSCHAAKRQKELSPHEAIEYCTGIKALSEKLACCESTVYMMKREGILDRAIKSQIGKKIVFNVDRARELANEYQKSRRRKAHENK